MVNGWHGLAYGLAYNSWLVMWLTTIFVNICKLTMLMYILHLYVYTEQFAEKEKLNKFIIHLLYNTHAKIHVHYCTYAL